MSKKEIKQTPESAEAKENAELNNEELTDSAEALKEIAAEEAKTAEQDADEASGKKKKKHQRTPEEEKERALNSVKRRKKLKYGTLATVITIVVVAIVVVLNVIVGVLDSRYNWNIDMTSKGLYQLDDQTIDYLHKINNDVKITMLADESYFLERSELKIVAEIMNRFKSESNGHVTVEYVDPTKNPEAITVYSQNYDGNLSRGDAVVSSGDLVRVVGFSDMLRQDSDFDYSTYQTTYSYTFVGEQSLVSAIMGVTDLHPVKIGMIDTVNNAAIYDQMDANCYTKIKELLEKNNYEIVSLDIANAELSDEYDALILCSPANDLTEAQITKLNNYLNNDNKYGKNLIYFGTPFQRSEMPHLNDFLSVWGISIGKSYISESDDAKAQYANIALRYGTAVPGIPTAQVNTDATVNADFGNTNLPIAAPLVCPVEQLFEQNSGRNTHVMLYTSESCYLNPLDESAETFDPDTAERGRYNLAVLADSTFTSGSDVLKSQVIAFGSAWIFDYFIAGSAGTYSNATYLVSVMNNVTGKENVLQIAEKSLDKSKISLTEAKAKAIRNVTVFIIPLTVALIGIFVYVRRRNK